MGADNSDGVLIPTTYFRVKRNVGFPQKPWACSAKSFLWRYSARISVFSTVVSVIGVPASQLAPVLSRFKLSFCMFVQVYFWSKWRARMTRSSKVEALVIEGSFQACFAS